MSSIVNKIKDAMHSDSKSTTHSAPEGSHGPHSSRVANAADPRVDSDRDGSNTVGGTRRTAGHGEMGTNNPFSGTGTTGHSNPLGSSGTSEGAYGPHSSRLANAADPRVGSDRDGSNTMGGHSTGTHGIGGTTGGLGTGSHATHGATGGFGSNTHSGHSGAGMAGMTGSHGAPTGTHGPHSSRMANAADPRVDSDRDGSNTMGGRSTGTHGIGGTAGGFGTGSHATHAATGSGPGPAANTAGPHKSDMLNRVDPRVDSDLDGSNTMGANKTYQ